MSVNYSVSSADLFQTCQRRWWFDKIIKPDGCADDDRSALDYGSAVHLVMERHLQDIDTPVGKYPGDRGEVVDVQSVHLERTEPHRSILPRTGHGYLVEGWLPKAEIVPGYRAVGKLDTWTTPSLSERTFLGEWPRDVVAHVNDWKTTSSLAYKSPEKLREENQGPLYAAVLQRGGAIPEGPVLWSHGYVVKSGPAKWWRSGQLPFMSVVLSQKEIDAAWKRNVAWAEKHLPLMSFSDIQEQEKVPANKRGCNAFNRKCPFMPVCSVHQTRSLIVGLNSLVKKKTDATSAKPAESKAESQAAVNAQRAQAREAALGQATVDDAGRQALQRAAEVDKAVAQAASVPIARPAGETAADRAKAHADAVAAKAVEDAKAIEARVTSQTEEATLVNARFAATGVTARLPGRIAPPDQIPVQASLVQGAFLRECASLLVSASVERPDAEGVLAEENLPPDYYMNVIEFVYGGTALSHIDGETVMAGWPNTASALLGNGAEGVSPDEEAALAGETAPSAPPPWEGEDAKVVKTCEFCVAAGNVDDNTLAEGWRKAGGAKLATTRKAHILRLLARVGLSQNAVQDVVVVVAPSPAPTAVEDVARRLYNAVNNPAPTDDGATTVEEALDIAKDAVALAKATPAVDPKNVVTVEYKGATVGVVTAGQDVGRLVQTVSEAVAQGVVVNNVVITADPPGFAQDCVILSGVSVRSEGPAPYQYLRDWPVFQEVFDHVVGSLPTEGTRPLDIPELWNHYADNFGRRFAKLFEFRLADEALPSGMWLIAKTDPLRSAVVDVLLRRGATVISADNG